MKKFIEENARPALWCNGHTPVIEVQALEEYMDDLNGDIGLEKLKGRSGLYFSINELVVMIVMTILLSGGIGIMLGSMYTYSENHAKIMTCANKFGMNCGIFAEPIQ